MAIRKMLNSEIKKQIIEQFAREKSDTGSPEVQVALLSKRIKELGGHFKSHLKDHHSRRGLLQMVSKRRRLLDYLSRKNHQRYLELINQLELRR